MKTLLIGLTALLLLSGCTNKNDMDRALEAQGFTNIQETGYNFFSCSQDDFYHSGFKATNAQGKSVEGTVCSGILFKSATIRF